jgi:hypothetical protein
VIPIYCLEQGDMHKKEKEILGPLGLAISEFPLDLVFSIVSLVPFLWMLWMYGYGDEAGDELFFSIQRSMLTLLTLLMIGLAWFAWVRRKKLGRL